MITIVSNKILQINNRVYIEISVGLKKIFNYFFKVEYKIEKNLTKCKAVFFPLSPVHSLFTLRLA
jgi:hypothetical protein